MLRRIFSQCSRSWASMVNSRTRLPSPPAPGTRSTPCSWPPASAIWPVSLPSGSCRASSSTRTTTEYCALTDGVVATGRGSYEASQWGTNAVMRLSTGMRHQLASPDAICAAIAARQHGVVTLAQLLHAGLTKQGITRRVAAGRLHRVFRGVYAVGHAGLSSEGRWFAAVAACGERSVLSHRSAAELWRLLTPTAGPVHVTVAQPGGRARRRGLIVHHSSSLLKGEVTRRSGIRVTAPARTLADLRRTGRQGDLRRAERQAAYLGFETGNEGG